MIYIPFGASYHAGVSFIDTLIALHVGMNQSEKCEMNLLTSYPFQYILKVSFKEEDTCFDHKHRRAVLEVAFCLLLSVILGFPRLFSSEFHFLPVFIFVRLPKEYLDLSGVEGLSAFL